MSSQNRKNNLIGIAVFTASGYKLGYVGGVEIENKDAMLKKIYVKRKFLLFFLGKPLVVDRSQILKIEEKKIIVDDAFVRVKMENTIYMPENA